jgi:predicted phage terminase large subunit-like protein
MYTVTVLENRWIPHRPTSKQAEFLMTTEREVLYGGSAGGGKSAALLMAALQYADVPGYAAILFRRTYADLALPGALMDRAHDWLQGTAARWSDKDKTWTFPSGATLTFGYLETYRDHYRYQSSEFQFIGFDELTQFEESQYTYLFSRLRRLQGFGVPLRMRAASNPGGVGHGFVKQRFLVEGPLAGRLFIPSKLDDNPHLDREQYRQSLKELDPFTRSQLLEGDWSEYQGGFFRREWFPILDVAPDNLERKTRAWDLAATETKPGKDPDWSAGVLMARTKERQYIILDVRRTRATPLAVQQLVRAVAEADGKGVHVYMEEEAGSSGKIVSDHFQRNVLAGYAYHPIRSTGSKRERAAPLSSMAEAGHVKLLRAPWNGAFLDELAGFPAGAHDDQVDAASLCFAQLARRQTLWVRYGGDTITADKDDGPDGPRIVPPEELPRWLEEARAAREAGASAQGGSELKQLPVDVRPGAPGWHRYGRW